MNRETLALIWAGNISKWNDPFIANLNPELAPSLPNTDIILGYNKDDIYSLTEVFKLCLESFSPDFATLFSSVNRSFDGLPPAQRGTAEDAGISTAERILWLQVLVVVAAADNT